MTPCARPFFFVILPGLSTVLTVGGVLAIELAPEVASELPEQPDRIPVIAKATAGRRNLKFNIATNGRFGYS